MKTITDLQASVIELERDLRCIMSKRKTTLCEKRRWRKIDREIKELRFLIAYLQTNPTEQAILIQLEIVHTELNAAESVKKHKQFAKGEWERQYNIPKLRKQKKDAYFLASLTAKQDVCDNKRAS